MDRSQATKSIITESRMRLAIRKLSAEQWAKRLVERVESRVLRAWCAKVIIWRLPDPIAREAVELHAIADAHANIEHLSESRLVEALVELGISDVSAPKRYEPVPRKSGRSKRQGYRHGDKLKRYSH